MAAYDGAVRGGTARTGSAVQDGIAVNCLPVVQVTPATMLAADAYLFIGPENLGGLSGAMKELLDTAYYPLLGHVEGRAFAHIVAAGSDGAGAARQLARIVTGWRLKPVADPLIVPMAAHTQEAILAAKTVPPDWLDRARDLGATMAVGLEIGIF